MPAFLEIDHVDRTFSLPDGSQYVALKGINLKIQQGEFVSLVGHSGCGKSTLLNILAGLDYANEGGIVLAGREVIKPGPDRMMVFQNYSLLPWLTVSQNIALAVNRVYQNASPEEKATIVDEHLRLVNLDQAKDKRPHELSGGMKQRVAIARALALKPKLLLLDEPFGALDALTRGALQEQLMRICEENSVTAVMVTHDVDEAILLSDRVVMLTNGPSARIGQVLEISIPRPRNRLEMIKHPSYYSLRGEIIDFLNQQKRRKESTQVAPIVLAKNGLEKVNLNLGFIPLNDSAPFLVALEKGLFQAEGLDQVTLSRESSWKSITEGIISGRLDAAPMVTGMPLAISLGIGGPAIPIVTPMVLSRNGNAITLHEKILGAGVKTLADYKQYVDDTPKNQLGMVHPASMHNLILRYWLASGGIDPDEDVDLLRLPPAQMASNLKAGNIDGYCVGDPWNSWAVHYNLGGTIATDLDLWPDHPEKMLGLREDWVSAYPETTKALIRALVKACQYCDDYANREEIVEILCRYEYVGSEVSFTRPGFLDPYQFGTGRSPQNLTSFNRFFHENSNYPNPTEGLWILTQLARWSMIPFPSNYPEILDQVYRPDLLKEAIEPLEISIAQSSTNGFSLYDGIQFVSDNPLHYLQQFQISRDVKVQSIALERSSCRIP